MHVHVRSSSRKYYSNLFVLFIFFTIILNVKCVDSYRNLIFQKCCLPGYIFNENLICVTQLAEESENKDNAIDNKSVQQTIAVDKTDKYPASECRYVNEYDMTANPSSPEVTRIQYEANEKEAYSTLIYVPLNFCIENTTNGTKVVAKCPEIQTRGAGHQPESQPPSQGFEVVVLNCSLGTVVFWGAQTYMTTNIAHVVFCTIVVVVYLSVPELGRGLYNRAVLRHNVSLMMHGCVLTLLGYCDRDQYHINDELTIFLWIVMQFFTNATVFWLNVICFDMTLAITRFRWIPGAGHQRSDPAENRRLLFYGIVAWGGALIPAIIAAICEYIPGIPRTFVLKPNYLEYSRGPSITVNMYYFMLPLLTLFLNNVLFLFTTYKIIQIQRSTEIATSNQTNILKKKYVLILRLYLLMGAPWFFGALFACLNKLVILKMCRLTQPILWLLMLTTQKDFRKKVISKLRLTKIDDNPPVATIHI